MGVSKSTAEKKLTGTLQKCRENRSQFQVGGKLPVAPPVGLTKEARAAWTLAIICAPDGMLTALDHSLLERWARTYAMYRKVQKAVEKDGVSYVNPDGVKVSNPDFIAVQKMSASLSQMEKELGFSPASRARVRVPDKKENEENAFLEM